MRFRKVAPKASQALITCKFRTYNGDCNEYFQDVMTEDGVCFTFNALTSTMMFTDGINSQIMLKRNVSGIIERWTLEDGYDSGYADNNTSDVYLYPYHVLSAGSKAGLRVVMATKEDDMDYVCRGPSQGFKVILHNPNELPQVSGQYFRIPVGQDIRVSIKPNMLQTAKSLKDYSPQRSIVC